MIDMKVIGGPALLALIGKLPENIGKRVGRGAVRAGAQVVLTEAQSTVRRRNGRLANSLQLSSRARGTVVSCKVVARGPGSFTAPWIEYGVKPHWITVADEDVAAVEARLKPSKQILGRSRATTMKHLNRMVNEGSLVINGQLVGPYVHHPGFAAFPFLRPALHKKAEEAINVMGRYMAARLSWDTLQAPTLETAEADEA